MYICHAGLDPASRNFELVPGLRRGDEQWGHTGMGLAGIQYRVIPAWAWPESSTASYRHWPGRNPVPRHTGMTNSGTYRHGLSRYPVPRHTGMGLAGIQNYLNWFPAFAGKTNSEVTPAWAWPVSSTASYRHGPGRYPVPRHTGMGLAGIQYRVIPAWAWPVSRNNK